MIPYRGSLGSWVDFNYNRNLNLFLICVPQNLHIAIARIGIDLGIFDAINESKEPTSLEALAEKTGAAPELLGEDINNNDHLPPG